MGRVGIGGMLAIMNDRSCVAVLVSGVGGTRFGSTLSAGTTVVGRLDERDMLGRRGREVEVVGLSFGVDGVGANEG